MFDSIWNKIRELISEADKFDDYCKEYTVLVLKVMIII